MARELACGETYGEPELYGERQRQRADLVFQGRLEGYLEGVRLGGVTRRAEEGQRRRPLWKARDDAVSPDPVTRHLASDTWGPAACSPAARSAPVSLLLAHDQLRSEVLVVFYWGRFWSVCAAYAPRTRILL